MSTLGERKSNESSIETGMQLGDTKRQIDSILQQFDIFTSRFDKFMLKYIPIYLISLLFGELLIVPFMTSQPQAKTGLLGLGVSALPMMVIVLLIWLFNARRLSTPKTLRDLLEKKRIYLPNGNTNTSYLCFLENYRDALASPKRYFLSVFPMIVFSSLSVCGVVLGLSIVHPNILVTLLFVAGSLLSVLSYLGVLYCTGIVIWAIHVSGRYVRKLIQTFELRIQPSNTDKCGGLKMLGNFCFGLVSPLLTTTGLLIGYLFIYFIGESGSINAVGGSGLDTDSLALARFLYVGFPLLLILLYIFPAIILTFILPLWDIHTKMVSEREADEDTYNARIEALREEIQSLLDSNEIEEAKIRQEKKAILETLHIPYPTWPFSLRSKIFSTILGTSGSILIGMVTAVLPTILSRILHNP